MTASQAFSTLNMLALACWLVLIIGIVLRRPFLRDKLAGAWMPIGLSAIYTVLVIFFFGKAEGGFDTLENVQRLFTSPWVAVAGWVHYLAFDLFMGSRIARETETLGLPRWILIGLLPLTFMFGPSGYLAFEAIKAFRHGAKND